MCVREINRQTDIEREREIKRERDKETDRQRGRKMMIVLSFRR